MGNLHAFGNPYDDHDEAGPEELIAPDNEKLQKLVAELVEATSAKPKIVHEKEIRIRNFRSERLALTEDLIVVLEERDGDYLANSYDTGQYGYGYSPDGAIEHLCSVLEDYFDLLTEDEGRLSPQLDSHLRYLKSILRERQ